MSSYFKAIKFEKMQILKISTAQIDGFSNKPSPQITKDYLEKNMCILDYDDIVELSKGENGNVLNVLKGLQDHVYVSSLIEDNFNSIILELTYINGQNKINGFALKIDTAETHWMAYIASFTMFLSKKYDSIDPIDGYNTYISQLRTIFEKLDFFTITFKELENPEYENSEIIVSNPRGVVIIRFEEKIAVYREMFRYVTNKNISSSNKTYLMYSGLSNLIKIGRSINPKKREKTLQGEDPRLEIIAFWDAPASTERELHNIFSNKRKRGEWFNLNFGDLMFIRSYMESYE